MARFEWCNAPVVERNGNRVMRLTTPLIFWASPELVEGLTVGAMIGPLKPYAHIGEDPIRGFHLFVLRPLAPLAWLWMAGRVAWLLLKSKVVP